MSLKQRLDKLAKTRQAGRCSFCATHNPIRVFTMADASEQPPDWPGATDPRECPRCGRRLGYIRIGLYPHAHPPLSERPEVLR